MRVVAVDTSTERGSVAVVDGGEVRGEVRLRTEGGGHSTLVLPAVDLLLRALSVAPRDVEGYAVTVGPGSFTGVRVGVSTVQGLALGADRPCLGVSTLDVLAASIAGEAEWLVPVLDAYRGEVYVARYDRAARRVAEHARGRPEEALRGLPAGCAFVGDAALRYADLIRAAQPDARFPRRSLFLAGTLGRLAEPRLAAGEGVPASALRALYLRDADARLPRA